MPPDDWFHGFAVIDFAMDPRLPLLYLVDDGWQVVAVNTSSGRVERIRLAPPSTFFQYIAVDAQSQVYVTANNRGAITLFVFNAALSPLRNVSLATLTPPSRATQVVVDSTSYVFLFGTSETDATVWVLEPRFSRQVDTWRAPVPLFPTRTVNSTSYVLAIDASDTLYFQQQRGNRLTFLTDTGSNLQAVLDLFAPWRADGSLSTLPLVADVAVDSGSNLHLVLQQWPVVLRFDTNGRPLQPLAVLSGGSTYTFAQPCLDFDRAGLLLVADPVENAIVTVAPDGSVTRALRSPQASLGLSNELLQDPNTGDLLIAVTLFGGDILAQRISARDGSLLEEYRLPERLRTQCRTTAMDVGATGGSLYFVLSCASPAAGASFVLYVLKPNGRVQSELRLPFGGDRLRVDEDNDRLFFATYAPLGGGYQGVVRVMDLHGRDIANVTTESPPLSFLADLVLAPGPEGGELVLLDNINSRLVYVRPRDGRVTGVLPLEPHDVVWDMAFERDSVYVSVTDYEVVNNAWTTNSSVARISRAGAVTQRYGAYGSPWDGPEFGAITVGDAGLFAFDFQHSAIYVWRDHRRPPPADQLAAPSTSTRLAAADVAAGVNTAAASKLRQGRHALMRNGRFMRGQ